jgi:hypothetical protein
MLLPRQTNNSAVKSQKGKCRPWFDQVNKKINSADTIERQGQSRKEKYQSVFNI